MSMTSANRLVGPRGEGAYAAGSWPMGVTRGWIGRGGATRRAIRAAESQLLMDATRPGGGKGATMRGAMKRLKPFGCIHLRYNDLTSTGYGIAYDTSRGKFNDPSDHVACCILRKSSSARCSHTIHRMSSPLVAWRRHDSPSPWRISTCGGGALSPTATAAVILLPENV